jgi:hypothetical protein
MIAGLSGSLLSHDALGPWLSDLPRHPESARTCQAIAGVVSRAAADLGPAHAARTVFDRLGAPLARALGLRLTLDGSDRPGVLIARVEAHGRPCAVLIVTGWGRDPSDIWHESIRQAIAWNMRWCLCVNGPALRIVDARRTYMRRFAEIDLGVPTLPEATCHLLAMLLHAEAFTDGAGPALDRAVQLSDNFRASVRSSLQAGVHASLTYLMAAFAEAGRGRAGRRASREALFDESLTVVYRILFLLFAEARGLVPKWHPTYRDGYTIEALREPVERFQRPRGLWAALQAIARLAHSGCRAGELRVPPFNGRLFSPAAAPLAATGRLDDGAVREALLALTTRSGRSGRERVSYADLGVEQLGGVYERILDYSPSAAGAPALVKGTRRKETGAFYTPRSLTEFVVRRTLAPLVHDRPAGAILALRIVDPAMGSGAFLVAACRYLAAAYEAALIREGAVMPGDVRPDDRAGFRRGVAQRCLFGVDLNPTAVQLGRLSLWLATLARDRPLTFLDHHLRSGNSLAGASLQDLARRPGGRGRLPSSAPSLFGPDAPDDAIAAAVGPRLVIAEGPGDTLQQVREKERLLAAVGDRHAPIGRWRQAADLWCAGWFSDRRDVAASFPALADEVLGRGASLPPQVSTPLMAAARAAAGREQFFHWPIEFPEVFHAVDGTPSGNPGFDAVIGNPPWEMLRGDAGSAEDRRSSSRAASRLTAFARGSGLYPLHGDGHANLYQLFVERSLGLVRRGGRIGLILPSGFLTDHGCGPLRQHLLARTQVDACVSLENRDGLFPIHRSLRFLLLCATSGGSTPALPYRAGVRSAEALDRIPELGADGEALALPAGLLERVSGPSLAVPEIRSEADLALVSRLAFSFPALGDPDGWHVRFGRELNATDDRPHFVAIADAGSSRDAVYPVVEGKHVQPFRVDVDAARAAITAGAAARLLDRSTTFGRARLAYRDVSSATNRLTLIAALIPPDVLTTHTLFCLKGDVAPDVHLFLCGIFNSFVANYLVRLRVTTHVSAGIIGRLPVPKPAGGSREFADIVRMAATLATSPDDSLTNVELQAAVARLYALTPAEFAHVLGTFPLIDEGFRRRCAARISAEP